MAEEGSLKELDVVRRGKSFAALELRRLFPPIKFCRLNMCGMRPLDSEDGVEPSEGCMDWYCSNSRRRALRDLR